MKALYALLALSVAACAMDGMQKDAAMSGPAKVQQSGLGPVLADGKGMTLYTFDNDKTAGKSVCNGPCATNWPPLMAGGDAKATGEWAVITRDDGAKQWAYKGKPLYTWVRDQKPGDTTGQGFNNVWQVAKP